MTVARTQTANEILMGMEARTRSDFERCVAQPRQGTELPSYWTTVKHEVAGVVFVVSYHPERSWLYEFILWASGESDLSLRGAFDSRDACLDAMRKHMGEVPS